MDNITVNEFKINIGGTEYTFRLDFGALIKFNSRYENAWEIFNGFLVGKNGYECIAKILACACVEKDFTEKEFFGLLSFDFVTLQKLDRVGMFLIQGSLSDDKSEKGSNEGKN